MISNKFLILCVIAIVVVITSAVPNPQYQKSAGRRIENGEKDHVDDFEDDAEKDDLKSSASFGYGYYGYPVGGYHGYGYPYGYGLYGGYYGYPHYSSYGGYGYHGHYFR